MFSRRTTNFSSRTPKKAENKGEIIITLELMNDFREVNDVFDKFCQLELRQPLPDKQRFLWTDASFQAAGYAVLTEDDRNHKFTSTEKPMPQ